jgi:hypothetical protein
MHTNSAFLADCKHRMEQVTQRMLKAVSGIDEAAFNRRPDSNTWSPGQVVDHLVVSNRDYIPAIKSAIFAAQKSDADGQVHFSFFGKQIIKAAGPNGNAPAPRKLWPRSSRIDPEVIEIWKLQQEQIVRMMDQAAGMDLSRVKLRNPLITWIPMNLADCFEILTAHSERHVAQVEQRMK